MKKNNRLISYVCLCLCLFILLTTTSCNRLTGQTNKTIRLSTTTSVHDSGLLSELKTAFEVQGDYELDIIANGTGAAIKLGETGDADVLLVHAKNAEDAFVEAGYGVERLPFMHNYFIIAGDAADPADIRGESSASAAFSKILQTQSPFVSRGDDSGTHKAEMGIWEQAGMQPSGDWYIAAGKGMGPCLTMAGEVQAYIFSDKATWLATRAQHQLDLLVDASEDLKNTYSVIAVSKEKHPEINHAGAQAWINFLASDEAAAIINTFGIDTYGEALFTYDGFSA